MARSPLRPLRRAARRTERGFLERAAGFDTTPLPVLVDLLVYTAAEWDAHGRRAVKGPRWVLER